jgi:hypothetical protein
MTVTIGEGAVVATAPVGFRIGAPRCEYGHATGAVERGDRAGRSILCIDELL